MIFVKTQAGQQALKDRHGALTPRQRSAFILFDGKRTLEQVLDATRAMGITEQDVQSMVGLGLLEQMSRAVPVATPVVTSGAASSLSIAPAENPIIVESTRSPSERYQDAYRIATELTAGLGLRGLPLNLAVEAAGGYKELQALAPKIRAAVGETKFARLDAALNA